MRNDMTQHRGARRQQQISDPQPHIQCGPSFGSHTLASTPRRQLFYGSM